MRYYVVKLPDKGELITTNVRRLKELPEGARVFAVLVDRYGDLMDEQELPVKNGRVVFPKRGSSVHAWRPTVWTGRATDDDGH